jgi:geranylgeranyl reductase family protein
VVDSPDVLVVGAGPAGSTAARALALGGARVRLLERAQFPRNKPCGGGLTTRALKRFPHLAAALERIETHYISRLYLEGPAHRGTILSSPTPAVVTIRRVEFDRVLAQLAEEAGAELIEGAWVSTVRADEDGARVMTRDGREFRADYLVAADGVNGIIARRLGLSAGWDEGHLALDVMEESPNERLRALEPDTLWVSYGQNGAAGYGYIFPKRSHTNVGIGCLRSSYRERVALPPHEMQQRFVGELRQRNLVDGAASREDFTPYHLPLGGPISTTARGRVLVAGDAGGFVNAYTGEGIFYAMVTGELAARAILDDAMMDDPRRGTTAARAYVDAWRREIGGELRDSVLIQKYLFRDVARIDGVADGASVHRAVSDAIIAYATGELTYREARRFLIRRFPRALFRLLSGVRSGN